MLKGILDLPGALGDWKDWCLILIKHHLIFWILKIQKIKILLEEKLNYFMEVYFLENFLNLPLTVL